MKTNKKQNKNLAAVCGLYCGSCTMYIISQENPEKLSVLARKYNITEDELKCNGCRSDNRCPYCSSCNLCKCANEKGIDFCNECMEFPCNELKTFQAERPHRIELWDDLKRIKSVGYEKWIEEVQEKYLCTKCNTINSAYDLKCRKCGNEPSCRFVELYSNEIKKNKLEF